MSQRQPGPHTRAMRTSIGHIGQYILITLEQLLWRAIALSPVIYVLVSGQFFGLREEYVLGAALLCWMLLWILLVLPGRFRVGAQLNGWFGADADAGSWSDRLARGLVLLSKVFLFVLPIFAYLYTVYYIFTFAGFPEFFKMMEYPGKLIIGLLGGENTDLTLLIGGIVWVVILIALTWLAFWGWRRFMMPYFYLPADEHAKRRAAMPLGKTISINLLIVLPPLAIVLALLGMSLAPRLSGSMMFDTLTIVTAVTQFDFPAQTFTYCIWVMALVYLPFVLLRKAAIAASFHTASDKT